MILCEPAERSTIRQVVSVNSMAVTGAMREIVRMVVGGGGVSSDGALHAPEELDFASKIERCAEAEIAVLPAQAGEGYRAG